MKAAKVSPSGQRSPARAEGLRQHPRKKNNKKRGKGPLNPDAPHLLDLAVLVSSESSQMSGMEGKKTLREGKKPSEDGSPAGTDRPKCRQDRASPKRRIKPFSPAAAILSCCCRGRRDPPGSGEDQGSESRDADENTRK